MKAPKRSDMKKFDECNFEETSLYSVWISCSSGNPPFHAVVSTGFSSGAYRAGFSVSGESFKINHRCVFSVIEKIKC